MNKIHLNAEWLKGFVSGLIEEYQKGTPFYHLIHGFEIFVKFRNDEIAGIEIHYEIIGDSEFAKEYCSLNSGQTITEAGDIVNKTIDEMDEKIKIVSKRVN